MNLSKEEVYQKAQDLITRCQTAVLCTLHITGAPDARAMLNLHNPQVFPDAQTRMPKNKFFTYMTTNFNSEKTSQIRANSKATLYYSDGKSFEGVTVIGELAIIKDQHVKNEFWREDWLLYYPGGKASEDYTLLKFTPKLYKFYDGNFNVWKYEI